MKTDPPPTFFYDRSKKIHLTPAPRYIAVNALLAARVLTEGQTAELVHLGELLLCDLVLFEGAEFPEYHRPTLDQAGALVPVYYENGYFIILPDVLVCLFREHHKRALEHLRTEGLSPAFEITDQTQDLLTLTATSRRPEDALRIANRLSEATPRFIASPNILRLGL